VSPSPGPSTIATSLSSGFNYSTTLGLSTFTTTGNFVHEEKSSSEINGATGTSAAYRYSMFAKFFNVRPAAKCVLVDFPASDGPNGTTAFFIYLIDLSDSLNILFSLFKFASSYLSFPESS
jgi:hypothetical protein